MTVLNFLDRGNEAQRLTFEILSQKLDLFGKVLDASDVVLHDPTSECSEPLIAGLGVEFESRLRKIYQQARSIEEVTEQLRELRRSLQSKREDFEREQARTTELISSRLDDSVRQVFSRWQSELPAGLQELDRDLDQLLTGYLSALEVTFERQDLAGHLEFRISPHSRLPSAYRTGTQLFIGSLREHSNGEQFHMGHPLFVAAVDEARQATSCPLHVVCRLKDDAIDCLLPVVRSEILELKPAVAATTWKLPLAPRPWMLPLTLRPVSVQVPVTSPPAAETAACRLNL